jgi:hypothetical protein
LVSLSNIYWREGGREGGRKRYTERVSRMGGRGGGRQGGREGGRQAGREKIDRDGKVGLLGPGPSVWTKSGAMESRTGEL